MAEITSEDIQRAIATELTKHGGNTDRTLSDFVRRDFRRRERIRELEGKLTEAEKVKPADGAVVLSKEEAARWTAYEAIGRKPEELATALKKGEEAVTILATQTKRDGALAAAKAAAFENPEALLAFPGALDLEYEVRTEKVDGEEVKKAFVKVGGETKTLDLAFIEGREDWRALKGALGATDESEKRGAASGGPTYTPDRVERGAKGKGPKEEDIIKSTTSTVDYAI